MWKCARTHLDLTNGLGIYGQVHAPAASVTEKEFLVPTGKKMLYLLKSAEVYLYDWYLKNVKFDLLICIKSLLETQNEKEDDTLECVLKHKHNKSINLPVVHFSLNPET